MAFPDAKEIRYGGEYVVIKYMFAGEEITTCDYQNVGVHFYGVNWEEASYIFGPGSYFIPRKEMDPNPERTDQANAIIRLRQVAKHFEETGEHYTSYEVNRMRWDSVNAEMEKASRG